MVSWIVNYNSLTPPLLRGFVFECLLPCPACFPILLLSFLSLSLLSFGTGALQIDSHEVGEVCMFDVISAVQDAIDCYQQGTPV